MYTKRETHRQGLIRDTAIALARRHPYGTERNYRQNVWAVMDEFMSHPMERRVYFAGLSQLGKTRLFNAIAREAVIQDRRLNFRAGMKFGAPFTIKLP